MSLQKFTSPRQWFRALTRTSVHAGTGAILSTFGTNGAEQLAPEALKGIGLSLEQAGAVFVISALLAAVKFINETTTPDENHPSSGN